MSPHALLFAPRSPGAPQGGAGERRLGGTCCHANANAKEGEGLGPWAARDALPRTPPSPPHRPFHTLHLVCLFTAQDQSKTFMGLQNRELTFITASKETHSQEAFCSRHPSRGGFKDLVSAQKSFLCSRAHGFCRQISQLTAATAPPGQSSPATSASPAVLPHPAAGSARAADAARFACAKSSLQQLCCQHQPCPGPW